MVSKKEKLEQLIISYQKSVESGEFNDQEQFHLLQHIEAIKRQLATFEPGYTPPPKPTYPRNTLTDDEKDEIDVLADAEEDMHGIPEIAAMGVKQARAAIRRLVRKEWISLFWYEYWCAPGPEE